MRGYTNDDHVLQLCRLTYPQSDMRCLLLAQSHIVGLDGRRLVLCLLSLLKEVLNPADLVCHQVRVHY
jgi:hypothetical protein